MTVEPCGFVVVLFYLGLWQFAKGSLAAYREYTGK